MLKRISMFLLAMFLLGHSYNAMAENNKKIVIAIQPTSTPQQLETQSKELESFLEERLKMDVEILFPTSYAGVIEALRFGHAQAAFMGSWPATMARAHAGAEVVLAEVREVIIGEERTEAPYYFSYWVVTKDSAYNNLSELKGKKAAFPSQMSSSGFVAPMSKLVELGFVNKKSDGVDPKEFFGEALFAGGYAQAWEALKAGQVDVTVIAGDVPEKLYREVLDNTRVLDKQGPIPSHVVVTAKELDPAVKTELTQALLALNAPEYRELMRKFVSGIFVRFEPASAEHLSSFDKMLEATGFEYKEKGTK